MKKKFLIGGVIIAIPIVFLSYMGFKSAITYVYDVDQFLAQGTALEGKTVRIGGEVMPGVVTDAATFEQRFTIVDVANQDGKLEVVHRGALPDTFKESVHVIVEGQQNSEGIFEAKTVATKCASKYSAVDTKE